MENTKVGWRPKEWQNATSFKHSFVAELIRGKKIQSKKIGGARVILTSPQDFLARHVDESSAEVGA